MLKVIDQARPEATPIAGIAHTTLASAADGLRRLSLWRQVLDPGAATPPHSHECDEVVICLSGRGEVHAEGKALRFGADSCVVLPQGLLHQLFNTGPGRMEIIGAFGSTPVVTRLPDGEAIDLPWPS